MINTVIFDFDGVIHDTFEIALKINRLQFPGLSAEAYKDKFNGNLYRSLNPQNETAKHAKYNEFFKLQAEEFRYLKIEESIKAELLKMKKKRELFIVSSNQEKTLKDYFRENQPEGLFKEILGFETHTSKIHKFTMLIDTYGLTRENCIFVTDTLGDILEANNVGLRTIAVDFGFHERSRLEKGNPLKIVSRFEDIFPIIEQLETFKK